MHSSNKEHTNIGKNTRIYVVYIPTMAVLPYNTIIYYSKLNPPFLGDLTPLNKFTIFFGAVCMTDVQMTWMPHAHRKPK